MLLSFRDLHGGCRFTFCGRPHQKFMHGLNEIKSINHWAATRALAKKQLGEPLAKKVVKRKPGPREITLQGRKVTV